MTNNTVLSRHDNGVTTLTINRQEKLNALNAQVIEALEHAFGEAASNPETRVVVVTGSGEKAFVAGADIAELSGLDAREAEAFVARGHALMRQIERLGKPVIAAINGFALGGGCELALACTIRIAADNAMLGLPEVKLGLIPGYGGTQRLSRIVGRGRALHMMLTGDPVNAADALAAGLVTRVVAAADLAEEAGKLAAKLASGAPLAMRAIMDSVHEGADLRFEAAIDVETQNFVAICQTDDMREGSSAFLEKRKPAFTGR